MGWLTWAKIATGMAVGMRPSGASVNWRRLVNSRCCCTSGTSLTPRGILASGTIFFREMETTTSRVPYMVSAGNHEHYYNFSAYRKRFSMPGEAATNENLWYSFDFGGIHVAASSSEHDLALQAAWLRDDLKKAVLNRATVPWIVVMSHRPMYCSTEDYYDCKIGSQKVATAMEEILHEAKVDLFLA